MSKYRCAFDNFGQGNRRQFSGSDSPRPGMAYDIRRDRVGRGTVWYARSRKIRCRELIALLDKKSSSSQTFAGLR
jgi:hypothetical protein